MAINHAFSNAIADGTNSSIVRPSDWNSAHNFTQNLAGNTAGVASVAGTDIVWAGGANITVSANGSTISIVGGAGAAADGGVFITAPGSSQSVGAIEFSNANGVSFGMAGSTVTATVATNYQSQGAYLTTAALSNHSHGNPTLALTSLSGTTASNSAGFTLSLSAGAYITTGALSNHSHGDPTLALTNLSGTTASNSAGFTLSLSAVNALTTAALSNHSHGNPTLALTNISGTTASNSAGLTLSLSAAAPGAGGGVNFSAGTTSGNLDSVVFSNSNGVSFGLNGSTITASAAGGAGANTISYFVNGPLQADNLNNASMSGSSQAVAPFILPGAISVDFARLAVSISTNSTTRATTINTTISGQRASTIFGNIFSQGTGANSLSLQHVTSMSIFSQMAFSLSANANGSEYTVSVSITHPSGSGSTSQFTDSYATSQTNFALLTTNLSAFSGSKFVDIPFSASLAQSNYWVAWNMATALTTVQNAAWSNWLFAVDRFYGSSQINSAFGMPGATAAATLAANIGLGRFTTNATGTTASMPLANISSTNSQVAVRFELVRLA